MSPRKEEIPVNQSAAMQSGQPSTSGSRAVAPAGAAPTDDLLFDQTWDVTAVGSRLAVQLRILPQGAHFQFQLSATFVGGTIVSRSFPVSGDASVEIPLYVGKLALGVSSWTPSPSLVSFDLIVRISPRFTPAFTIVNQRVSVPHPTQSDLASAAGGQRSVSQ